VFKKEGNFFSLQEDGGGGRLLLKGEKGLSQEKGECFRLLQEEGNFFRRKGIDQGEWYFVWR
jgi:hypothetical protein